MNQALFTFLKTKIQAGVPALNKNAAVVVWNNQINKALINRSEKFFPIPACFIECINEREHSISLGIVYRFCTLKFHFAIESRKFERLQDLDFLVQFDQIMNTLRGNPSDTVQFSSMQPVQTLLDYDHTNMNNPVLSYKTCWSNTDSFTRKNDTTKSGVVFTPTYIKVTTLP